MALHCPAVVVVIALADDAEVEDVEACVADLLSQENVAAVYSTNSRVATEAAARIAKRLGLTAPTGVVPGAEASQAISDAHRGETVLVVDRAPARGPDGRWVRTGGGPRSGARSAEGERLAPSDAARATVDVVRLEIGDDGTRLLMSRNP